MSKNVFTSKKHLVYAPYKHTLKVAHEIVYGLTLKVKGECTKNLLQNSNERAGYPPIHSFPLSERDHNMSLNTKKYPLEITKGLKKKH